jgi:hypothetical protein
MSEPEPGISQQRPRAVSDILEGGARLAARHVLVFLRITTPLTLPVGVLFGAAIVWQVNSSGTKHLATGMLAAISVLYALVFLFAGAACLKAAAEAHAGARPSARAEIELARRRLGPALFVTLLLLIGALPAVALLVLPGITALGNFALLLFIVAFLSLWFSGTFSLALPALLIEERGIRESLRRSATLVRGRFWRALGTVFLGGILALFAGVLVALVVSFLSLGGETVVLVVSLVGLVLGLLFVAPLYVSILIVFYDDVRAREQAHAVNARADGPSAG